MNCFNYFLSDQIAHLTRAHQDAQCRRDHHEEREDSLFCGPRDETVHRIRTRVQGALGDTGHVEAVVDVMEEVEK